MTARKIISIQDASTERSQKRHLRGSVYRECGYLLHVGTDKAWHSSTPRSWNECWLMSKTFPFRSLFFHLLKRKKGNRIYSNLARCKGSLVLTFFEGNGMLYLKNLKTIHFLWPNSTTSKDLLSVIILRDVFKDLCLWLFIKALFIIFPIWK